MTLPEAGKQRTASLQIPTDPESRSEEQTDGLLTQAFFGKAKRMAVATAALGLALAACACAREIGKKFDGSSARSLTPGVSTLEDAIARLGPPLRRQGLLGGGKIARWIYLKDTKRGTESARLDVLFGSDGRMIRIVQQRKHSPN